ncbi:MAG: protein jag [Oscillospiraceae bacterium]|nr:protein jag [Oscillospiraceae bacterium]
MRETAIEVSGRNEDEAIQNALSQLGLDRDEVSVEILERAKPGFLGLGGTAAKVRVTYMTEGEEAPPPPVKEAKKPTAAPVAATPAPAVSTPPAAKPAEGSIAAQAEAFLIGLFEQMGVAATAAIREEKGIIHIELVGPNMGPVIGRRGETLDAIQQLTNYAVNRGIERRTRIYVDAENYRKKREEALITLAHKMAGKVVKYRKNMGLEPMNAYERHVIHTALQEVEGVSTHSSGSEPNRRVFITYEGPQASGGSSGTHREWS